MTINLPDPDEFLNHTVPMFGIRHMIGSAICLAIIWAVIGYLWDSHPRADNFPKALIGFAASVLLGMLWPVIAIMGFYIFLPISVGASMWFTGKAVKRLKSRLRRPKPIDVGRLIPELRDPYRTQADKEVEEYLHPWQQFDQKKLPTRQKRG